MKRLFIYAGYEPTGDLRPTSRFLLESILPHGDVIIIMDNEGDIPNDIACRSLYTLCSRHGEYDFGSYKRGYLWACENNQLDKYDYLYLLNDSVIGPLSDMGRVLHDMEAKGADAFGVVYNPKNSNPHIQSWFVGLSKSFFLSSQFKNFIENVRKLGSKIEVCKTYENGLSNLVRDNGFTMSWLHEVNGKDIYNKPKKIFKAGVPFFKRNSIYRHEGSLNGQIKYMLQFMAPQLKEALLKDLELENRQNLITGNPFVNAGRYLKYLYRKTPFYNK